MKIYYETGDIRHGKYGRTSEKPGHKYLHRIDIGNGKYRYFYTEEEYDRYCFDLRREVEKKNLDKYYNVKTNLPIPLAAKIGGYSATIKDGGQELLKKDVEAAAQKADREEFEKRAKVAKTALKNMIYNIKTELKKKKQTAGMSKEYLEELEYNSKKNNYPKKKK